MKQSVKLLKHSDRPLIIVNFAKQVYRNGDMFKFRVFSLNQRLNPYEGYHPINITIMDSDGQTIKTINGETDSKFGFYENSLKIPETENAGKWKIQVNLAGQTTLKYFYITNGTKHILEAYLAIPNPVSYLDDKVSMNIYVKHKDEKLFEGTADISVIERINGSSNVVLEKHIKTIHFIGSKHLVELNYKDELDITSPTSDMILTFNVKITDKITQTAIKISKDTEMKFKVKHTIKIIRREFFKPGFDFSIKYKIQKFNGNQKFVKAKEKMTVEYHNKNRKTGIETTTQEDKEIIIETNGEAFLLLNPTSEATKIVILCKLFELRQIETIYPLPVYGAKEYLHLNRLSSK